MPQLTEVQKEAVVRALACFSRPIEVVALMKKEFNVDVTLRQVVGYDPTRASYDAGERWREFFHRAREGYVKESLSVPIAHRGFRLRTLQRMLDHALEADNFVLAARLLEQAAKEVGGMFAHSKELPAATVCYPVIDSTPEERRAQMTEILREALARHKERTGQQTVN
ncbi:MAG: DUF2280 domain-containing protein [Gammaproteobacteria bacterium]|nr:MAG: DUF2280 domain-containing protein [Gammaproteobacteria bacterium]